ncbi:hypothetical protein SAMN04488483_5422 [Pseudomonas helmanticensis]|uniref:Uncharacterized protein n=1 Tax=Pseudomonas helmanticensis TaxID=1471381 RepID=A0ACD2UDL8_9PSED|nr:hypothetical protein [Pseudomonas helmanticensis]SMQ30423.1 hypothetical protein SAMN04488483_5422 [Pseudomonas helmanticensis]
MRSTLILMLTTLTYQAASAENCPNLVSTANGSFDLRAHIFNYGDRALPKAREILENRRAQGCAAANSLECHNAIELAAKTVDTLTACNTKKMHHIPAQSQIPQSIQKDSIQNPVQKDTGSSTIARQKKVESRDKKNIPEEVGGASGCPYLTKYLPGANHKPDTYVCINGGTRKCELMGKNEKQEIIYDWVIVSDTSCVHLGDWIDIDQVERDAANSRKSQ